LKFLDFIFFYKKTQVHTPRYKINLQLFEGSEQVHVGAFFLVTNELGVQFPVAGKTDATSCLIGIVNKMVEGVVNLFNIGISTTGDNILTVFIKSYGAITVDVNSLELVFNEGLEHGWELVVALVDAVHLDSGFELIYIYFTVLIEVSKEGDLVPQIIHDLAVRKEPVLREFTLVFKDGIPYSKTFEVILVKDTIVVNVVEVPDDVSDAVIVSVCCHVDGGAAMTTPSTCY